jgi:CheY-like chemotaxis protein
VQLLRSNPALANTRLIALTGYAGDADKKKAAEAGFDAHVTKPVSMDQLTRLVAEAGGDRPAT